MVISVNFEYDSSIIDYIFVSNLRRFQKIPSDCISKCIITSNISTFDAYLQVSYKDLLNNTEYVQDNAGLMLIKLLDIIGVKKIYLAGMDGYSSIPDEDYANQKMFLYTGKRLAHSRNKGIISVLTEFKNKIDIEFVTTPKHINL